MAEYIEREPMIEEMQRLIDNVSRNFPRASETELIILKGKYEAFMEYIKEQPTADVQPVDRWISVKDRLPEEMQDKSINSDWSEELRPSDNVLILTTGGSYDVAWYSHAFDDWTTGNEKHSYENWEVAYWQPLPEPPKEG